MVRNGKVKRPSLTSVDRTSVQIAAGESRELVMTIPPLSTGLHHGVVKLVGDDAMTLDDQRFFSVDVLPPSHVLLVCDDVDKAFVMSTAMNAMASAGNANAEYAIERIGFDDLPAVRLEDFDAAFLLDPPASTIIDDALADYVDQGGSVFISIGPGAGKEAIRTDALPTFLRPWRVAKPFTFLTVVQSTHPILATLSDFPGGVPWGDYRVEQYWQTETLPSDRVLMRYAGTKHPALIERLGASKETSDSVSTNSRGRWLILTTPLPDTGDPKTRWNDLLGQNAWPALLLVRFMAESLSGRTSRNWMPIVGQPQVIRLTELAKKNAKPGQPRDPSGDQPADQSLGGTPRTQRLQLFPPGNSLPIPIDMDVDAKEMVISDVSRSGTYWLRGSVPGSGFSANLPLIRMRHRRVDRATLDDWFGPGVCAIATNRDEVELAEVASSHRVALRSPLMLLALAVFLLELILGNRFYRGRRKQRGSANAGAVAA